jgi:hypothetical protein
VFRPQSLLLAALLGLLAPACADVLVGTPCRSSLAECSANYSCYVPQPPPADSGIFAQEGFCSRTCDEEGSTSQCPAESVCARSQPALADGGLDPTARLVCAALCNVDQDCIAVPTVLCQPVAGGQARACVFPARAEQTPDAGAP